MKKLKKELDAEKNSGDDPSILRLPFEEMEKMMQDDEIENIKDNWIEGINPAQIDPKI